MSLREMKDMENQIHEKLYENILVLTLEYDTSNEFKSVFKRDMFKQNNKSAFQHVVHFLLNILNPEQFKQKVNWPILDLKMETQFRNQVMKFINELTATHEDTGIPLLMTSHLISPGGFKFAEFMLKLSQFVLLEHIKRDPELSDDLLLPMTADESHSIYLAQLNNLNKIVSDLNEKIHTQQNLFDINYRKAKDLAMKIIEEKPEIVRILKEMKNNIAETFSESCIKITNVESFSSFTKKLNAIENILDSDSRKMQINLLQQCASLTQVLNQNKISAKSDPQLSNTISQYAHYENKNKTDLLQSFISFVNSLKVHNCILNGDNEDPREYLDTIENMYQNLCDCRDKQEKLLSELLYFRTNLEDIDSKLNLNGKYDNEQLHNAAQKTFKETFQIDI